MEIANHSAIRSHLVFRSYMLGLRRVRNYHDRRSLPCIQWTGGHRSRTCHCNSIAVTNDRMRVAAWCLVMSLVTAVCQWALAGSPRDKDQCEVLRHTI